MQIDHNHVLISYIVLDSDHLAIAHSAHLQDIVGHDLELRVSPVGVAAVRKSGIVSKHDVAVKVGLGVAAFGLRSPDFKKLQLYRGFVESVVPQVHIWVQCRQIVTLLSQWV